MKTLEEACLSTFCRIENREPGAASDAELTRRMMQEIAEDAQRWKQTAADVKDNELVQSYVRAVCQMIVMGGLNSIEAMISCFTQGVIVGIEMERGTPPIAAESVPGRRERSQTDYTGV